MRWAETTWASKGTPKARIMSTAWRITSQSLWLPMTMPTFGFFTANPFAQSGILQYGHQPTCALGDC